MVCGQMDRDSLNLPFDEKRGWSRGLIDGIDVIALPLSYSNHDGIGRRLITFFKYALKSIKIALDFEYDVVFATSTPLTAALPGIFASCLKAKNSGMVNCLPSKIIEVSTDTFIYVQILYKSNILLICGGKLETNTLS
jgi:hypothetical protein